MAFAAGTIWECRTDGSDSANGGGFDVGNASMSTNLAATNGNTATPSVTSASYTFVANDVGHWIFIKSGTDWRPGWFQITSVNAGAATVNAAIGAWIDFNTLQPGTSLGIASTASPSSGTWSVDYSQSATPAITFTDMVIDGTTNTDFTSAANPVGVNMIGNVISVTSGTGFTVQRVQLNSIPSGVIGRVDKSLGTLGSTGGNGGLGGAFATPGGVYSIKVANNSLFIKAGTYDLTNTANVSGGRINDTTGGATGQPTRIIGYETLRGDFGTKPLLRTAANSVVCINGNVNFQVINIETSNPSAHTSTVGFQLGSTRGSCYRCKATNHTSQGYNTSNSQIWIIGCEAEGCTTGFTDSNVTHFIGCIANTCGGGFTINSASTVCWGCLAFACTGDAFNISSISEGVALVNCSAYSPGGGTPDGFDNSGDNVLILNCLAYGFDGVGFRLTGGNATMVNCAGGDNVTDFTTGNNALLVVGFISLTADPFVNAGAENFALNNTVGGGAALRGFGYPGGFGSTTTTGYPDVGAVQSAQGSGLAGPGVITAQGLVAGLGL